MNEFFKIGKLEEHFRETIGGINRDGTPHRYYPLPCKDYLLAPLTFEAEKLLESNRIKVGLVVDLGSGTGKSLLKLSRHFQAPGLGLEIRTSDVEYARKFGQFLAEKHGYDEQVHFERCNIFPPELTPFLGAEAISFMQAQMPCANITEFKSVIFDPSTVLYMYGYYDYVFLLSEYLLSHMKQKQILMLPSVQFETDTLAQQLIARRSELDFGYLDNQCGTVLMKK